MNLNGLVCLVTGGTKGIGAATALALAKRGAQVAILGRHRGTQDLEIQAKIESIGQRCALITADVGKPDDIRRAIKETVAALGPVDVLVHSAGGVVEGGLLDLTDEKWHAAFDVHVHAVYHLCRAVLPSMIQKKQGSIVLISSAAGIRGIKANIAYQVVKGTLPQFTRALAFEFADHNIRINCVAPGIIRTAFHDRMSLETKKHNLANRIPLHREGTPEQVADLILEMITNDFITGETFSIDGGMTMRIC